MPAKFRAITSSHVLPLTTYSDGKKEAEEDEDEQGDENDEAKASRTYAVPNIFEILADMKEMGDGMVEYVALSPFDAN